MTGRTVIKICGIRTPAIAEAAIAAGADMIGVNFVARSVRCVSLDEARAVVDAVAGRVQVAGLVKEHTPDEVRAILDAVPLDMLQLHGEADAAMVEAELPEVRYMPAVTFDERFTDRLRAYEAMHARSRRLTALVVDAPDASGVGGGTGRSFDWKALAAVLDEVKPRVPIMLAGGLTAENVGEAIRIVRPFGVDVASGVESRRGVKDAAKIAAFCHAAG